MIVLIGASASGKTEISKLLAKKHGFRRIITNTTRPIRDNEVDGSDYHFRSVEEFSKLKKENYFIETEFYNGNFYGTSFKDAKLNSVLIVDPNGANSIYQKHIKNSIFFYLQTSEEIRAKRMKLRGDKEPLIKKRIEEDRALFNIENCEHVDYIVNTSNHTLEELADYINDLYQSNIKEASNG